MSSAKSRYVEGDQCIVCRHWWWDDGKWHSLVPKKYADTPELGRDVICPQDACQQVTGASSAAIRRVLVCGSRSWADTETVVQAIDGHPRGTEFIHGAARGADMMAAKIAFGLGYDVHAYPADWRGKGKAAGIIRNLEMLDTKPDKVIAFWDGASTGTKHTIDEAKRRGIPVEVHRA